ncbi:MAG TPA: RagB/SusD family nutrient uptake outer membrane protein [Gemmatimonadales bacterium]
MRTPVQLLRIALPLVATALSCSDITNLEQKDPSQILSKDVYVPEQAALLVNGAVGDFECAFFRYVTAAGLLGDELVNVIANTANYNYDRRTNPLTGSYAGGCNTIQQPGVYTSLSVARASADTVLARLEGWTDAQMPAGVSRTQLIGKAAAYAGYSLVLLGEGFCTAAINVGPELTPTQVFTEAEGRFDQAITAAGAAGDTTTLNLARVGRARTLLNLAFAATPTDSTDPDPALLAAAAAAAALVPAGFVVTAVASATGTTRQQNVVFAHTGVGIGTANYSSVDASFDSVKFAGVLDPRVRVINTGQVGANGVPIRQQTKYANLGAAAPIARTAEAQLIVAEAAILTGDRGTAVNIINALHAAAGIPAYDSTGQTNAQVLTQVRDERKVELFLESHRLGDTRRLSRDLVPPIGTPFPGGGTYGDQRCFPLPAVERNNNPNIPDV